MKYLLTCFIILILFSCNTDKQEKNQNKKATVSTVHYDTAVAEMKGVESILKIPAQLAAFQEVSIFPKVNGFVKKVYIDIGSTVKKGDLLLEIEAPELIQAVLQAREKYTKARADFFAKKDRYMRLNEAAQTSGAVSPLDIKLAASNMEADSAIANAEKANWKLQETMLDYLKVTAPFDGVITERIVHPGALITSADKTKPMLELKHVNHLRLQADIAENVAVQLKVKDTVTFIFKAYPGQVFKGIISRKSDNIEAQFQAERIELDIDNRDNKLSPGMYAEMILHLKGNLNALSVPRSAVVTSTEKKYVWVIRNGKNVQENVSTGNENQDRIEIFGNITAGEKVIANASDEIK